MLSTLYKLSKSSRAIEEHNFINLSIDPNSIPAKLFLIFDDSYFHFLFPPVIAPDFFWYCAKENLEPAVLEKCNRTITLSWKNPREVLTSPAFPNRYPNNIECHYHIIAPKDQKIVALFTDFVLEESQSCEYDVLAIIEEDKRWHHCGNWESKIKLLRHIYPRNYLYMTFSTDFSHSFKGFRVEFSLLEECQQNARVVVKLHAERFPRDSCPSLHFTASWRPAASEDD
ncbi:protocadherin Fat 1 [Caerostris extrusa]|uniref:Protocadherin Fat 1 n=1 Tax=Caerostris extrusa TaxID=172846 RepID=A0AAV4X8I1_CAEEX|nr:protocadherin Fat 1 [Caerostris extrusa]